MPYRTSDAFDKAYLLTFYNRRLLIDSCIKALEEGRACIVECGTGDDLRYAEYGICRVYFRGDMLVSAKFIVRGSS